MTFRIPRENARLRFDFLISPSLSPSFSSLLTSPSIICSVSNTKCKRRKTRGSATPRRETTSTNLIGGRFNPEVARNEEIPSRFQLQCLLLKQFVGHSLTFLSACKPRENSIITVIKWCKRCLIKLTVDQSKSVRDLCTSIRKPIRMTAYRFFAPFELRKERKHVERVA